MKCSTCGNELGNQALFCGKCGTPVAAEETSGEESLELKSVSAPRRGRSAGAAAAAAEVTGAVSDTAAVSSRASFKGAMAASHKKARRKMPVLVLMALFLLAGTTVAWAVYTFVYPQQANEREVDWTPQTVYEAMNPDRLDLEKILNDLFAEANKPIVTVKVPASIAEPEGDRLNFVIEEEDEDHAIIYYRKPAEGASQRLMQ